MSASFFWNSCVCASGLPNCLRSRPVLQRRVPARLGSAHHAPGNAVARAVEAPERPLQPADPGQQRVFTDLHVRPSRSRPWWRRAAIACPRSWGPTDRPSPSPRRSRLILPSCASDLAQTTNTSAKGAFEIHIFAPVRRYPRGRLFGPRLHPCRVRPRIGFRQTEASDQIARRQARADTFAAVRPIRRRGWGTSPMTIAPTSCCDSRCRHARSPAPPIHT